MLKEPMLRHGLTVELVAATSLIPNPNNSRDHSAKQVRQIAESIRTFGFVVPVLVDENNTVLAGHGRLAAGKLLGLDAIPVVRARGLTAAKKCALMLADNKLTDLSSFDKEKLKTEFEFLITSAEEFSIEATGFDIVEVDRLLNFDSAVPEGEEVELPSPDAVPVSRPGDL